MEDLEKGEKRAKSDGAASGAPLRQRDSHDRENLDNNDMESPTVPYPGALPDTSDPNSITPPSFARSEFQTIVRRQRHGNDPEGLKIRHSRPRSPHSNTEWDFAGWGSMRYLEIPLEDLQPRVNTPHMLLGQLAALSVAGNDMAGGVFYTFPLVAASAGVYSPVCLLVACLLLFFFRRIMLELASTVRLNGANYVYLLQFAGKTLSLVGAAATLLDGVVTATVSAATASTYLAGEVTHLPFSTVVLTVLFFVGLSLVAFAGVKESASITAGIFIFHMSTMFALAIASMVHWARADPQSLVLRANWSQRPNSALETVRALFYGICIAILGVTGFECTPSYIEHMRPKTYSAVLRNLIIVVAVLNTTLCFLLYGILPSESISQGANVLSVLADRAAGRWLRIIVVTDAVSVLLGGVMTGVMASTALFERLAEDRLLPQSFLWTLPYTGSQYIATLCSVGLALLLYVASGMNLQTVSSIFSIAFLFVFFLFTVSNLILKINRPRLSRPPHTSMFTLIGAFVVVCTTWAGNIVLNPSAVGVFVASFFIVLLVFLALNAQPIILRLALRMYDASSLSRFHRGKDWLLRRYRRSRGTRVCIWIKDDDIHTMLQALLSVQRNTPDACTVVFVHAYPNVDRIPSELHPNTRLLDEAFPMITIDLAFVQGAFCPSLVEATSRNLDVPRSRMCVISLDRDNHWDLADYGGARVIM
ncbi:hypothetical protein BV25DRAFT_1855218 [Artomyces pyxidatus]|uniref:Uncharacterized protein n=1 Tax=Artomyces pyxidatus TaxID=48021 RepID=A0ACB8T493_9AGAM|nr:hypothetical protein BV25DRAFT_1855218 [Artomyces pyxidatus]